MSRLRVGVDLSSWHIGRGVRRHLDSLYDVMVKDPELDIVGFCPNHPDYRALGYDGNFQLVRVGADDSPLPNFFTNPEGFAHYFDNELPALAIKHRLDVMHFSCDFYWSEPPIPTAIAILDLFLYDTARTQPEALGPPEVSDRILFRMQKLLGRVADSVVTPSHFTAKRLIDEGLVADPRMPVVAHLGTDRRFEGAHVHRSPDENTILFVGALSVQKNLVRLLEAFAQVVRVRPDVRLVVAGMHKNVPSLYPPLAGDVERLGLTASVDVIANPPDSVIEELYRRAMMFVFPSVCEGFGLAPLEAMTNGCPVACSNAMSLPEVVGDAALVFDPYDVDAITDALIRMVNDADLRDRLAKASVERATRFSWERCAAQTSAALRQAIAHHATRSRSDVRSCR